MQNKDFKNRSLLRIFLSYFKPHLRLFLPSHISIGICRVAVYTLVGDIVCHRAEGGIVVLYVAQYALTGSFQIFFFHRHLAQQ